MSARILTSGKKAAVVLGLIASHSLKHLLPSYWKKTGDSPMNWATRLWSYWPTPPLAGAEDAPAPFVAGAAMLMIFYVPDKQVSRKDLQKDGKPPSRATLNEEEGLG